jgi:hypothetical protein
MAMDVFLVEVEDPAYYFRTKVDDGIGLVGNGLQHCSSLDQCCVRHGRCGMTGIEMGNLFPGVVQRRKYFRDDLLGVQR